MLFILTAITPGTIGLFEYYHIPLKHITFYMSCQNMVIFCSYKLLLAANLNQSAHERRCAKARQRLLTVVPEQHTASAAVWAAGYTADWARQRRDADRHPPVVYGSGAAVVEVHSRGTCCRRRPFSSHSRSRRPWSDFPRGSLTFCLRMPAAGGDAVSEGPFIPVQGGSLYGPQNPNGSARPGFMVRGQRQSVIKRDRI